MNVVVLVRQWECDGDEVVDVVARNLDWTEQQHVDRWNELNPGCLRVTRAEFFWVPPFSSFNSGV